jgi:hypothetical protein
MSRLFSSLLVAALPLAAFAAPLSAQTASTPYFSVELAQPATDEQAIAGGVVFTCEGTTCTGPRSGDRPLRVCSELRREVGPIASFAVRGEPVAADLLARCNG